MIEISRRHSAFSMLGDLEPFDGEEDIPLPYDVDRFSPYENSLEYFIACTVCPYRMKLSLDQDEVPYELADSVGDEPSHFSRRARIEPAVDQVDLEELERPVGGVSLYRGNFALVAIDLKASDRSLKNEIAGVAEALRIERNVIAVKDILPAAMSRWRKNRLLAYLDICLYCRALGQTLTQQEMGLLLFPGDYEASLSEKVRNTVEPQAFRLINEEFESIVHEVGRRAINPYANINR